MSLKVYHRKRDFARSPEPKGDVAKPGPGKLRFVIQLHRATRLHFDLRLEMGGVFKSWAVPKGPSLNPLDQRLAVFVEDHPLAYGSFEGVIPKGNYGAGTVMIWDAGPYEERSSDNRAASETAMLAGLAAGHITFVVEGQKVRGEFALIKLKKDRSDKAWLLVKKRDAHASYKKQDSFTDLSLKTGRTMAEIAAQAEAAGDVWYSKRDLKDAAPASPKKPASTPKRAIPPPSPVSIAMPRQNKPMIATASRRRVEGDEWLFEPDLGGVRVIAEVEGTRVHIYSKSGLSFSKKYPDIAAALRALGIRAVLDGEIVRSTTGDTYHVYDVLFCDGRDLRQEALEERKRVLEEIPLRGKLLRALLEKKHTLRGRVIAKLRTSTYQGGTSSDWLVIDADAGPAKARTQGSGRAAPTIPLPAPAREAAPSPKKSARPVAPVIKTLRRAAGSDVTAPGGASSGQGAPRLTNLEKVYWPDDGITKGDVLAYYQAIAGHILPFLVDRPQSLNRHPHGITGAGFYQKDMTGHIPRWLKTTRIFSESSDRSIDYVLCQDERSLLYIANLGCIEINPWFSRVGHLDRPDYLIIDLDPDDNPFAHVIEVAIEVHRVLDASGAPNVCKTSGATGIHIGVPTGARYTYDEARAFAEHVCRVVARKFPATTSLDRNPNRRRKKIYLDFMQNRRGQTLAAPFCIRPRPGAPVSMPLEWRELRPGLLPEHFHIKNALPRIAKSSNPWAAVSGEALNLMACTDALRRAFASP